MPHWGSWFAALSLVVGTLGAWEVRMPQSDRDVELPKFYHTTHDLYSWLGDVARQCGASVQVHDILDEPQIPVVTLSKKGGSGGKRRRAFFLFGEHARELVSSEAAVRFIEDMCGQHAETAQRASNLLDYFEFQIVLVANPEGRRMVEEGDYCRRTNEHEVDLNRNWSDHFDDAVGERGDDTYPGPQAFSEAETRAVARAVLEWPPHMFLTVHSGTLGMYTPFAYSTELPANVDAMLDVLDHVNPRYCKCPMGAAGNQVGYLCPGTCLDYVYNKVGTPYSFAAEIYSLNEDMVQQAWHRMEAERGQSAISAPHENVNNVGMEEAVSSAADGFQDDGDSDDEFAAASTAALVEESEVGVLSGVGESPLLRAGRRRPKGRRRGPSTRVAPIGEAVDGVASLLETEHSCMLHARHHAAEAALAGMSPEQCLSFFNPTGESKFRQVLQAWSDTFMAMAERIQERGDLGEDPPVPRVTASEEGLAQATKGPADPMEGLAKQAAQVQSAAGVLEGVARPLTGQV